MVRPNSTIMSNFGGGGGLVVHLQHTICLAIDTLYLVECDCSFYLDFMWYLMFDPAKILRPLLIIVHWLKIQDRITYTILVLTYKSYYNIAPTYLCELISRRESSVHTRLGADHHQLIMPPISKDCSNTFLERSFIYAAPCEWNKLSECIRTSTFDSFRKSVKTMLFTQQYGC